MSATTVTTGDDEHAMVKENMTRVMSEVRTAAEAAHVPLPRLVAVSKFKGSDLVRSAYDVGQRHFGENYVQELVEKAKELATLEGIQWHFIGHLQSNKVKQLLSAPNLYMVETVDSLALAQRLDKGWPGKSPLNIFIQVNTSHETNKSGVMPENVVSVAEKIITTCPHIKLQGLMTIGEQAQSERDFSSLIECKQKVCEALHLDMAQFELSMGMSADFIQAIKMGSTNVRVGSVIFGQRHPQHTPQPTETTPSTHNS
ncbi:pyridoxal phosphate homeostasis protein [Pelomyxa schiedti]|nr:pyridoxal phosphate homeostasis protein [Pelomyxa schiedti]